MSKTEKRHWIPAFAGMTGMWSHGIQVAQGLRQAKAKRDAVCWLARIFSGQQWAFAGMTTG